MLVRACVFSVSANGKLETLQSNVTSDSSNAHKPWAVTRLCSRGRWKPLLFYEQIQSGLAYVFPDCMELRGTALAWAEKLCPAWLLTELNAAFTSWKTHLVPDNLKWSFFHASILYVRSSFACPVPRFRPQSTRCVRTRNVKWRYIEPTLGYNG